MSRARQVAKTRRLDAIGHLLLGSLYGLLVAWVLINWIAGCGTFERTIDGQIIHGQCILIPWVNQ